MAAYMSCNFISYKLWYNSIGGSTYMSIEIWDSPPVLPVCLIVLQSSCPPFLQPSSQFWLFWYSLNRTFSFLLPCCLGYSVILMNFLVTLILLPKAFLLNNINHWIKKNYLAWNWRLAKCIKINHHDIAKYILFDLKYFFKLEKYGFNDLFDSY